MKTEDVENRMQKIHDWLFWANRRVEDLLSRSSDAPSGWDPAPTTRPCEHREEWMRGRLCLACDNTGLRPLTKQEKEFNTGLDPYSLNVRATKGGWTVSSNTQETAAQAKSAYMAQLDAALARLERDAAAREGREGELNRAMRDVLRLAHTPPTLQKIERALLRLRVEKEHLYWALPRSREALFQLSCWIPGQIRPTPSV